MNLLHIKNRDLKGTFCTIIICIFLFNPTFSQPVRITIEGKALGDQFNIVPLGEKGALIFYENDVKVGSSRTEKWIFSLYDTSFSELWSGSYPLFNNFTYKKHYIDNEKNKIYLLFAKSREFQIATIDVITGDIRTKAGRIQTEDATFNDFKVIDDYAFLGGNVAPSSGALFYRSCLAFVCFPLVLVPNFMPEKRAFLCHFNLENNVTREITLPFKGFSQVNAIEYDTATKTVSAVVQNTTGRSSSVFVQELKSNGIKTRGYEIRPFTDKCKLLDGRLCIIDNQEKLLLGTYAMKYSRGAQGIYFCKVKNGKSLFINYQSFTTFRKFFDYLSKRDQERVQKKITNSRKKGKELSLSYQLLMHNPIIDSNQYIVVAESYYPQYHTEYRTTWYYGRPIETAIEVFDGWRYTHGIIAAIDKEGNLLWDNSLPIQDILTFNLNEKIKILKNGEQFIAAYIYKGRVQYKILGKDMEDEKGQTIIEANTETAKTAEIYNTSIEYWYGNYFIAFGAEKAKTDIFNGGSKWTTALFFNKMEIKGDKLK